MGDGNRAFRGLYRFQAGTFGRMAHINDQPDPVHFLDRLPAKAGKAGIFCLITSGGKQGLVIIGQLHEAATQLMQDFNQANIIFHRGTILKSVKDSCLAAGISGANIRPRPAKH